MEEKKKIRKTRCCRSCCTPMKGHRRRQCRPNPWCDHGDNNKQHGGHYEWETQRWTGSKWEPLEDVVNKNEVVVKTLDDSSQNIIVPLEQISQAPPPGTCPERDAWLAFIDETSNESDSKSEAEESDSESALVAALVEPETTPVPETEKPAEPPAVEEEWKPLADRYWWNYYTNWQQNSTFVKFPTLVGMTSAQLGDIMENYGKYRNYYYYN